MLSKDTLQFLDDLKANNNRDWFLENKKRYEIFKNDYLQTANDLLDALKPLDPSLEMLEGKKCTFRINRDIRFSKDKTPYKTHLSFWFSSGAKGQNRSGYYIHLEKGASFIAGGLYCPEAGDLKKIRKEIAFFYDDLEVIFDEKDFKREFTDFAREDKNTLKNPPRGYEKEHPAIDLLKLKSFESAQKIEITAATKKDFVAVMSQKLIVLKPLNDFLNRALTSK
jgi:uncharacterized protein (TIGR02453 family)